MSRFFASPSSSSSSSDDRSDYSQSSSDISEEVNSHIEDFKKKFIDTELFSLATDEQWRFLETQFKNYLDSLVWDASTENDRAELITKVNEIIESIETTFDKARLLLLMKQFLFFVSKEHVELSREYELELLAFLNAVAPVKLMHHSTDALGTVQVRYDGDIVGYFKPGVHRQESDIFLFRFYQFLKNNMALPDDFEPVFAASYPCLINLSDVEMPDGQAITADDEITLSYFKNAQSHTKIIPLIENSDGLFHGLSGGIQKALPVWHADASPLEILIMLSMVLLIAGRDIKEDGIFGSKSGTLVDVECYLEKQYAKNTRELLPDLHIPFHTKFSGKIASKEDWEQLQAYLLKLSAEDVRSFVESQKVSFEESAPGNLGIDNECTKCRKERDDRSEYLVEVPTYEENRFLSQEQIAYLIENLIRLQESVQQICEKEDAAPIYSLLKLFDPLWAQEEYNFYTLMVACGDSSGHPQEPLLQVQKELLAKYSEEAKEKARLLSSSGEWKDYVGWQIRCPTPEMPLSEETIRFLNSNSPVGFLNDRAELQRATILEENEAFSPTPVFA